MSADFGVAEFAVGSVFGYRHWKLNASAQLQSPSHSATWLPGENVAKCGGFGNDKQVPKIEGEGWEDRAKRVEVWKANHEMVDCDHGFYAYFAGSSSSYESTLGVSGIIEGYGETLIGTKGFRCMKAKIVALCVEPILGQWRMEKHVEDQLINNYPGIPIFRTSTVMRSEMLLTPANAN